MKVPVLTGLMEVQVPQRSVTVRRMIDNLIKRYGVKKTRWLLSALCGQASGMTIARYMEVSKERARQWKVALGVSLSAYELHPEVLNVLRERNIQCDGLVARHGGEGPSLILTLRITGGDLHDIQDQVASFVDDLRMEPGVVAASFDARCPPKKKTA